VKAGDRIVKIDGKNVASIKISNTDVMKKLKVNADKSNNSCLQKRH